MRVFAAFFGGVLIIAGAAAQVIADSNRPAAHNTTSLLPAAAPGWSVAAYDAVRIAGWALIVFGAVIVAFALIQEIKKPVLSRGGGDI